ncbi:MAG: hypothetical protein EDM05_56320 [Leptolyngbya sp. IPPAS B-1204]
MNLEQAVDLINAALVAKDGKSLTDAEVAIITGAWQGQTYSAIAEASGYSLSYLSTDIGPAFWRRLSHALGEKVSKTNVRSVVERHGRQIRDRGRGERGSGRGAIFLIFPRSARLTSRIFPIFPTPHRLGRSHRCQPLLRS